jgi:adenosylcobinamide kinase/adenosylcobinamide-phosphate guanylyltransferase
MGKSLTLILGGARSGKSALARRLAGEHGGPVLFVATAEAVDDEMAARIERHRAERPAGWQTLEAPRKAGQSIRAHAGNFDVLVLDCLTVLAGNILGSRPEPAGPEEAEAALGAEIRELSEAYSSGAADWIVVSNEVGLGLVPPYPLGRAYRDALGRANQHLAALADTVLFMIAGLPLRLKG